METEVCSQSQLNTAQREELEAVSWEHKGSPVVDHLALQSREGGI